MIYMLEEAAKARAPEPKKDKKGKKGKDGKDKGRKR